MGWYFTGYDTVCVRSDFLISRIFVMFYEITLQNAHILWLAFQTKDKTEAMDYFKNAKAQYVYLRILDDNGHVISMRCNKC